MRIILQKDVKNLGQVGDIVSVKRGYARHLLFPKKLAIPFTKGSASEARHRKVLIEAKKKKALNLRESLLEKLKGINISFVKSADSSGKLFGSVTNFEISKKLLIQGYEVDKRFLKLAHPLKETGEHKVLLDFGSDRKTEINIHISALKSAKESEKPSELSESSELLEQEQSSLESSESELLEQSPSESSEPASEPAELSESDPAKENE